MFCGKVRVSVRVCKSVCVSEWTKSFICLVKPRAKLELIEIKGLKWHRCFQRCVCVGGEGKGGRACVCGVMI